MSEELQMTPSMVLAFFASVIKSGEPWTDDCQKAYDEAQTAISAWNRRASPTPESIRREALEEAAKVADEAQASAREEVESDKEEMGEDFDFYTFGAGFLSGEITASINIATAIRALSPLVNDTTK